MSNQFIYLADTLFYLMVAASGAIPRNEVLTSRGQVDLEVEFADKVSLIEFKCNQNAEVAIQQIQSNGYPEKFKESAKKLILMGINFSTDSRTSVFHEDSNRHWGTSLI